MEEHVEAINPGPIDSYVLNEQHNHRSSLIWNEVSENALTVRRWDKFFWRFYERSHERVKLLIDVMGFGGVVRAGYYIYDHSLITALVERWRPETHTFHLTCGEATITLQDVALIWGLPIEGNPVTGPPLINVYDLCERCLGYRPVRDDLRGRALKKICLERILSTDLPDDATEVHYQQRARALVLYLIGGLLFSDHSGNLVKLIYLSNLENIDEASNLSWGSAVLAYLYRSLCLASKGCAREISGPLVLLQLWAWERLPMLRPILNKRRENRVNDDLDPLGAWWNCTFDLTRLARRNLLVYRDQFDSMPPNEFIWMPYNGRPIAERYRIGYQSWIAITPLICWEIIESHCPERVTRQFGIIQQIPPRVPAWHAQVHSCTGQGTSMTDWSSFHRVYINLWHTRLDNVVSGAPTTEEMNTDPDYFTWYIRVTRVLIGNPMNRATDGYIPTGGPAVVMSNLSQDAVGVAEEHFAEASSPARSGFQTIRTSLRQGIKNIGSKFGCRGSISIETSSTDTRPISRPKDKIQSRGAQGVRRGGRRREMGRDAMEVDVDVGPSQPAVVVDVGPSQPAVDEVGPSQPAVEDYRPSNFTMDETESEEPEVHLIHRRSRSKRQRNPVNRYTPG